MIIMDSDGGHDGDGDGDGFVIKELNMMDDGDENDFSDNDCDDDIYY